MKMWKFFTITIWRIVLFLTALLTIHAIEALLYQYAFGGEWLSQESLKLAWIILVASVPWHFGVYTIYQTRRKNNKDS